MRLLADQGKEVQSFRRPATVIGTKAATRSLSEWMGRRGKPDDRKPGNLFRKRKNPTSREEKGKK